MDKSNRAAAYMSLSKHKISATFTAPFDSSQGASSEQIEVDIYAR